MKWLKKLMPLIPVDLLKKKKKKDYDAKLRNIEGKIPSITY